MLTGKSNIISVCFFLVRLKSLWQWMLVDCTCTISCVCLFGFRYLCFSDISICILITCISFMFQPFVLVGLGADSQKVRRLACIAVSCYLVFLKFIHKKTHSIRRTERFVSGFLSHIGKLLKQMSSRSEKVIAVSDIKSIGEYR